MATILLIDDDAQVRMFFQIGLKDSGYRALSVAGGREGLRLLHDQVVDVILVDIFMPDMDGLELIPLLRKIRPTSKIIAITEGSDRRDYLEMAKHLGANDTLKKPLNLQELLDAVASQLK
jgi:DNA-binding response OmpR family regulator